MYRFSLKRGLKIMEGQHAWRLDRRLGNGNLYLESEVDAEVRTCTIQDFHSNYLSRRWSVVDQDLSIVEVPLKNTASRDLATFSKKQRAIVDRKLKYVEAALERGRLISTPEYLIPIIAETANSLGDKKPPSAVTVYRWCKRFLNGLKSSTSLVDRTEDRGRRLNFGPKVVEEILLDAVDSIFLNPQKYPIKSVWNTVAVKIEKLNIGKSLHERVECPSRSKIYRYVKSISSYEKAAARLGKEVADRDFRKTLSVQKSERILERWETDHTPLNIIVVDDIDGDILTLGKPWLTVIIDKHSRMVMGYYISFASPSTEAVMNCLKMAILPKDALVSQYPSIKHDWPVYGIPELLVCDNGMEFHSEALKQVCQEMMVELLFCPAKRPEYKGTVERFMRTIVDDLIHTLPGTVFSNTKHRGAYPSEALASINFKQLLEIITKWIVDVYSHNVHRGLGKTPYEVWMESLQNRTPIELPADPQQFEVILGIPAKRKLFHYGVEVNGSRYNSDTLHRIFVRKNKIELSLKYYEHDLGYIHVFDPEAKEYIRVGAINPDVNGRTLAQNKELRKLQEQRGASRQIELWEGKEYINNLAIDAAKGKKMAHRKKGQVLRGVSSVNPDGIKIEKTSLVSLSSPLHQPVMNVEFEVLPRLKVSQNLARPSQFDLLGDDHE